MKSEFPKLLLLAGWSFCPADVLAHSAERGLILLLPTELYIIGGALAVLLSFLVLAVIPHGFIKRLSGYSRPIKGISGLPVIPFSLGSSLVLAFLIITGFFGSRDPLLNPLPITTWTLFWVLFTLLQCITGNLWTHVNPWSGIAWGIRRIFCLKSRYASLPESLGYLPGIILFAGFAWFELVDPAPEDPHRLAWMILLYWLINLIALLVCGEDKWFERGEPFSIFFRLIGTLSPLQPTGNDASGKIRIVVPGLTMGALPALPLSGTLFVLLTLSTVSFDGLSGTFFWLGMIGVNPLEFPGRSAVIPDNTLGLLGGFGLLVFLYLACVYAGWKMTGSKAGFVEVAGRLVYSIIPISLVFHCAHYLTRVLVNVQYAFLAWNDPLSRDWNLLGASNFHVTTSFFNHLDAVAVIWGVQTAVIVLGHVIGVFIAHVIALDIYQTPRVAVKSQVFPAILMVGYTVFGLWLLSTPAIG